MKKMLKEMLSQAEALGARVEMTKNSHWKVFCPDGSIVVTGGTPSDRRALLNFRAQLRRAGLEI